jgi:hypothetical protein
MKITMTKSSIGITREDGAETATYENGKEYKSQGKWQDEIFKGFIDMGMAHEVGGNAPVEETKAVRARTASGKLKADDPITTDYNEAWVGGKSPAKAKKKAK